MSLSSSLRCLSAVAATAGASLALAPAALAGTLNATPGGPITYANGGTDNLTVTYETAPTAGYRFADMNGVTGNCIVESPTSQLCPGTVDGYTLVDANLGGGNDTLLASSVQLPFDVTDGNGDDDIRTGSGNDIFRTGSDAQGADIYRGNVGFDRVSYVNRNDNLAVSIAAGANDGEVDTDLVTAGNQGEGDNVQTTIEAISSGSDDDVLTGDANPNTLAGFDGEDTIAGGDGNDFMGGGGNVGETAATADADNLDGGTGSDTVTYSYLGSEGVTVSVNNVADDGITGSTEDDNVRTTVERVNGTNQDDTLQGQGTGAVSGLTLVGFGGNDSLIGTDLADFLDGGPGTDTLNCRAGQDTYRIEGAETVPANCENGL